MNAIRKVLTVLITLLCLVCITGCDIMSKLSKSESESGIKEKDNDTIYIWTDEETGVQYVIYREKDGYSGAGGITPRLNADGSLYVEKTAQNEEK